jgi:AcrR family transcriptional regulator
MARPRAFDETQVLDRAMDVFWRQGYDGASMGDLTRAMGINSPSIYVAFGSKRGLFDAVLHRYDERRAVHKGRMLCGETAREIADLMLRGAVRWLTTPDEPRGCLLIQAGLAASGDGADIPDLLARRRQRLEHVLTKRFEQAKEDGDLEPEEDARALARYVQAIFSGLAVQAAAGASASDLNDVVARAMVGWPTAPKRRSRTSLKSGRSASKAIARPGRL